MINSEGNKSHIVEKLIYKINCYKALNPSSHQFFILPFEDELPTIYHYFYISLFLQIGSMQCKADSKSISNKYCILKIQSESSNMWRGPNKGVDEKNLFIQHH